MRENPLTLTTNSFERYGDFIHYPLGPMNVYIVSHPDSLRKFRMNILCPLG